MPPQSHVDTSYVVPTGQTLRVVADGDFQDALNRAEPGDVIELEAGATFRGPFRLPRKPAPEWITIRTDATDKGFPSPGTRVNESHAALMPKLVASEKYVIRAEPGAHHYRFIGIEIHPAMDERSRARQLLSTVWPSAKGSAGSGGQAAFLDNLVLLGTDESSPAELAHHIVFDRCYLHGDEKVGARRGIAMNSREVAVIDSRLSDFKAVGVDSQAIAGWNGPGPFKIVNNYLEAAGENVMFGGADASIADLVPSDIEIRRNHMTKPLGWKLGHASYEGTPWAVKNLFELKNARRVLVDGNVFEHNWPHAQNGFAILLTVRNEDGRVPWAVVENVIFTNNILRRVGSGFNMLGKDDNTHPSRRTNSILIRNNLFEEVGGVWGQGILFQFLDGVDNVAIENNTAFNTGSIIAAEGRSHRGLVFIGNIVMHNEHGIIGRGTGIGNHTLRRYFPGAIVRDNAFIGGPAGSYPRNNAFPSAVGNIGFTDISGGNFVLRASSAYRDERSTIGVDFPSLCAALATSERPAYCSSEAQPGLLP